MFLEHVSTILPQSLCTCFLSTWDWQSVWKSTSQKYLLWPLCHKYLTSLPLFSLCFHHTVYHNLIYFVIFCYCCFVFSRKCMEAFWRPEFAHFSSPVYPKRWAQHLTEDKTHKGYKILPLLYFGENMLAGHSIMDACRRQRLLGQK
jgi:hypothetical protein